MTHKKPDELIELQSINCPLELTHLWLYFLELNSRRTSNGFGYNAFSFTEIASWKSLTGTELSSVEYDFLLLADKLWMKAQSKPTKQEGD